MEEDFFNIRNISTPEGILLEVGGLCVLPNGNLGIATLRGEIYIVENPTSSRPFFRQFASGLHEPFGWRIRTGHYAAQRGKMTKMEDTDHDGKADVYKTVYTWPLSGHYHEYSFGPKIAPDRLFFCNGKRCFWRRKSVSGEHT